MFMTNRKEAAGMENKSLSVSVKNVDRVLIFDSEKALRIALGENDNLEYLVGLDEIHRKSFPGVYMAGFKAKDNAEG